MAVSRETSEQIRLGLKDSWLVAFGLIPLGLALGLLMTQVGFAWWWTPIFSTVIYAGSMEFLAIDLVLSGVGPLSAAITGFMVNFRHIFYGLTFPRHAIRSAPAQAYVTYAVTDEAYAVTSAMPPRTKMSGARLLTIVVFMQTVWVLSGIVGALAGQVIPPGIEGFEFALTALFAVLALDAFGASRDLSAPLVAGGLALLAALIAPSQIVIIALVSYFAVLVLRFWSPRIDEFLRWTVK